jgi:hypothetical protein
VWPNTGVISLLNHTVCSNICNNTNDWEIWQWEHDILDIQECWIKLLLIISQHDTIILSKINDRLLKFEVKVELPQKRKRIKFLTMNCSDFNPPVVVALLDPFFGRMLISLVR